MRTQNVYSVSQVNRHIQQLFVQDFALRRLSVRGEVSNLKYNSSGHIYFTLKDENSALEGMMFAQERASGLRFRLENGQKVVAVGRIQVYEKNGTYRLYAEEITREGMGELYQRFLELKEELEERGLFAPEYKRPIPRFVRTLGVVTAPTGAVIRDIINVSHRRNPYVQILLYPVKVQGEGAAAEVAHGLKVMDAQGTDCIIVGRGGGSLEDLWAFNEETVAQAIFDCSTPVISAVGHETDTTIADFVADLRAPTPSAAAELAVFDYYDFMDGLQEKKYLLTRRMQNRLREEKDRLNSLTLRLRLYQPEYRIASLREQAADAQERLNAAMERKIEREKHRLSLAAARLDHLSPLKRLGGGYAFVSDPSGRAVRSIGQVSVRDALLITLRDGRLTARVEETEEPHKGPDGTEEFCGSVKQNAGGSPAEENTDE